VAFLWEPWWRSEPRLSRPRQETQPNIVVLWRPPFPAKRALCTIRALARRSCFPGPALSPPVRVFAPGLVSTVDLTPTLLELAGVTPPETMQGRSFRSILRHPGSYAGHTYVFRGTTGTIATNISAPLIRTDTYTELPPCITVDIGASPSILALRARAKAHRLAAAQSRPFESPRVRLELYDLAKDPWERRNVADEPRYAKGVRELAGVLQEWMEQSGDFPAAYRVRADNTDRITGVPFTSKIPPLRIPACRRQRSAGAPGPEARWTQCS
jgi:hypothetical protein